MIAAVHRFARRSFESATQGGGKLRAELAFTFEACRTEMVLKTGALHRGYRPLMLHRALPRPLFSDLPAHRLPLT